ncbi:ABC transporter permease subunit [Microbacterium sp. gxy059]|uniref:ABC transporter permease subunit n=1 Tax=Microbacterium sp. gxy059 TaxID=2957199 RepID=UPI003D99F20B
MTSAAPETEAPESAAEARRRRRARSVADAASVPWYVWAIKIALLGGIDALAVYASLSLIAQGQWIVPLIIGAAVVAINVIYLVPGMLPAKYLTPGLVFLLVFQIFIVLYSGYIAFTNFGSGHNSSKADAVHALLLQSEERVENSPSYPTSVLERDDDFFLLVTDPSTGEELIGGSEQPLESVANPEAEGYRALAFDEIVRNQDRIGDLSVPLTDDLNDGSLRTTDGSTSYVFRSDLVWDETADTMTDTATGTVYSDEGTGAFVAEDGTELQPGWQVWVGADNFVEAFTEQSIRGPFIAVFAWNIAFAVLSVATTFALGLFLAIVFNDPRMKSKKYYRVVMILPYAFPGFLSALVWMGMYNEDFGFINQVILGGAQIPWLNDPTLAKVAILLTNLWLGFPYMFLICTGALQALPEDVQEAGRIDGASAWQVFRHIKMPLLMISVAPLLISSFSFNFNNFNLIYMLTGGGPRMSDASINAGHTDLLISMVYKVAFIGSDRDYGLASAFSIIIFLVIAGISLISFRRTKMLEELN